MRAVTLAALVWLVGVGSAWAQGSAVSRSGFERESESEFGAESEFGVESESESESESEFGAESESESESESEFGAESETLGSRSACQVRALGPSQAGVLDGMAGVPRRACLRSEVALAGDLSLIVQPAEFYGNIRASGRLRGSVVVADTVELWADLELVRYQSLISAVSTSYLGLGYSSLGAAFQLLDADLRAGAVYTRVVLPTTSGLDQRTFPLGLEVGASASWLAHENFRFHTWVGALMSVGISELAAPDPRGALRVGGGVDWLPFEWLSLVLEVQSSFGFRDGVDYLALSGGARFALGDVIGIDLHLMWPFVGAERVLAAAQLAVSARLDGL